MWCRYELWVNALEEQCLYRHRHMDDVARPTERSKAEETSEVVIQGAINAGKPLQPRSKDMVMVPAAS